MHFLSTDILYATECTSISQRSTSVKSISFRNYCLKHFHSFVHQGKMSKYFPNIEIFYKKKERLGFRKAETFLSLEIVSQISISYKCYYSLFSVIFTRYTSYIDTWCLNISRAHSCYGINDIRHIVPDNRHASLSRRLQPARVINRATESFHFSLPRKKLYTAFNVLYVKNMFTARHA